MRARIFLAAAMMLVAAPAFADATASSAVQIGPFVQFTGQFALALLQAILLAATPWIAMKLYAWTHLKFTDAQWAVFDRTALNWARQFWAKSDPGIANASIEVGDPAIAAWAQFALAEIPPIVKALGLTPQSASIAMQRFIVSHLGGMQAIAAVPAPAAKA